MAYIGRDTDKISNIEKLDTITFDGSSSYTLQKNSVNFTPNSANSLQVSIDGVVQAGNFTVSGSTIDFGVAIPATSTNDFIFHYGTGLITTPADGTVGLAQLSATGTKDSTTFLRGDNTFAEAGGGITEADQWRLSAFISANVNPISSNLERVDNSSFAKIGTGMSVSSGIWSFPSTGLYLVQATSTIQSNSLDNIALEMFVTINNSTYDQVLQIIGNGVQSDCTQSQSGIYFVNVTDTSNVKVKFAANSITTGNIQGSTSLNYTSFTFIRLGDSQ